MVTGWSSGLAWADETGGTAGSTAASSNESSTADAAKSDEKDASNSTGNDDVDGPNDPSDEPTQDDPTSSSETPADTASDDEATDEPATSKGSHAAKHADTKTPALKSKVAKDDSDDATGSATATHDAAANVVRNNPDANESDGPSLRIASTQSLSSASQSAAPNSTPEPPSPVATVIRLASGVVNAILSPFAATGTPGDPAATPSVWSLMAFARREFEKAFAPQSLTSSPVKPQTTSTTQAEPEERTLVLSAFPAEADAILARTTLDDDPTVVVDGRHFYLGTIGGKKVIVAMTGIGMENATHTTETALSHFTPESGISIGSVVFSGVAGGSGRTQIGSVAVPARWTSDDGATWHAVDSGMLAAANRLTVDLQSTGTIGDPACRFCGPLAHVPLINLGREPQLFVGGDGSSDDNNNGATFPALPSIPVIGDIFGSQPYAAPDFSLLFTGNLFQAVVPFLTQGLLSNLTGLLMPVTPAVDAVDQETAAAQQVAEAHGIPFLGIRGMSDGPGDPLGLPGYPFTFVVYKQIAADNAAIVTEAFLQSWSGS
jgi:nucleoside phosphorylase